MNSAATKLLQRKISDPGNLPAMPSVLSSLTECLSSGASDGNIDRIVELISYDKSLAAQCLRLSNSALFGRRVPVDTVRKAVLALGIWKIRDIVYSCSLPNLFGASERGMAPPTFWRHALGTALVSQHLAQRFGVANVEKFYLAGLLHDIGILVNSLLFPNEFHSVLKLAELSESPLAEVELEMLGFTHCNSGRVLADIWKLPADIAETIEFHHQPLTDQPDSEIMCTVYPADLLCRLRGLGYGYYEAKEFDLVSEPAWLLLKDKYPAVAELDLARFTLELDEHAVRVQDMVDSIFGMSSVQQ